MGGNLAAIIAVAGDDTAYVAGRAGEARLSPLEG
jgi:hypothetical protein